MRIRNLAALAATLLVSTAAWAAPQTAGMVEPMSVLLLGTGLAGLAIAGNPRPQRVR